MYRKIFFNKIEKFNMSRRKRNNNEQLNPMHFIQKMLSTKETYCKYKNEGCNWKGLLKDLNYHLDNNCPKEKVNFVYKECKEKINRDYLDKHKLICNYRKILCEDCKMEICFIYLNEHRKKCPKFKIFCYQNCDLYLERRYIEQHIKEDCPNTIFNCDFM